MLGTIKKDFMLILSDTRQRIFLIFMIPFFLLSIDTQNMEWLYFVIIMGVSHVLVLTPFYYEASNNSASLIASLPITRKEIIIYKYLSVFFYFLITIVYVGIYLWIINKIGLANVDYFNLAMIKKALPYILISMALTLFVNFIFTMRIAQIANMVIYMIIVVGSFNLAQKAIEGKTDSFINFLDSPGFLILSFGIFILSMIFSVRLYGKKDL